MVGKVKYPIEVTCRKNCKVVIKPLLEEEIPQMIDMYKSLDERDLAMLRNDVLDPNYEKRVRRQIEDNDVFRLAAWNKVNAEEEKIVGVLALHRGEGRWLRQTSRIRMETHPQFRRFGIAISLFEQVIPYAASLGIEKLYAEVMPEQKAAIDMIKKIGFTREATLRDHIKDKYNLYHHLRIYSIDLEAHSKAMEEMLSEFQRYSG